MNKLFTKIAALALGMTMATGVGVAVASSSKEASPAQAAGKSDWVQVTALSGINTTDTYVIANDADQGYFMNGTVSSGHFQSTAFSASAPASASAAGAFKFEAVNASSNIYKIKLVSTSKYVKASKAGSGGGTVSDSSDSAGWKFLLSGTSFNAIYQTAYSSKYAAMRCYNNTSWRTYSNNSATSISTTSGTVFRLYKYSAAVTYTISYNNNGGSGTMSSTTGTNPAVAACTFTAPTGKQFDHWNTASDDTGTTYAVGATPKANLTLYAIWIDSRTLSSISVSGYTTTFDQGDAFVFGGTVTAHYDNSSTANVTSSATFSGYNMSTAGSQTVTVSYTEGGVTKTTSYSITVNKVSTITFVAGTDVGTASSVSKGGVTISSASGESDYSRSDNYRVYSGKDMTIASTVGNIAKIDFTCSSSSYNTLTGTGYTKNSEKGTWTGDSSNITLNATGGQTRINEIKVTLASSDPTVELDVSSATSVVMLKGNTDTSVKVRVTNIESPSWTFTYDEDETTGKSISSYISISASALVDNVSTLTITTKATGSTTFHISVSGTACEDTVPVTVNAKPASMIVTESDHETQITTLELQSGGSNKQVYWIGEDTDGNSYSITASQVNGEIVSGNSYVSISSGAGTYITPVAAGTAVIRYSLKVLSSVYAEITVNVVDDYKTTVNSITFNSNLTDTQGDAVDTSAVFATKVANTHFGSTAAIEDSELLFSYENNRSGAEGILVFSYDFSHGTTVDATHKSQTIYVFTTFDSSYSGNYTITIEQKDDPLTAITFTNVVDNEVDVTRGSTFQLEWAYTPTNPTDGKEVVFRVDDNDDGIGITVSAAGLISISASSDLGTALVVIESAHDATIYDYVYVTATMEAMTYTVREAESLTPVSTVSSGDRVYMVATATDHDNKTYEFSGYPGTYGGATEYTTSIAKLQLLVVEAGTESGTVSFKLSGGDNDGEYISYSGSSNTLNHTSTKDATASWTVDGSTITNANNTARQIWLNWNNGTPRFACYTNKTSTTGYYCPTFLKVTGGDVEYTVDETLFNGVHDNFGEGKTYEWDAACASFNTGKWSSAGTALTGISGYANYKLNRAVANASGNEIEQFLAKYDNVIIKFGTTYDFLGRFAQNGINYGAARATPTSILGENANTVAIVVIVSVISVSAIGGYFFLRRRKEN